MKLGLLVVLPLAMWLFIDILVPSALSATSISTTLDFRAYFGPILGTIMNVIGSAFGVNPNTAKDLIIWSPFIFGVMMGFTIPIVIILGLRLSLKVLATGVDVSLADETLHVLYIFMFFLGLYIMAAIPAALYLTAIEFPFALLFLAITSIAYMIGVFGLITWGG